MNFALFYFFYFNHIFRYHDSLIFLKNHLNLSCSNGLSSEASFFASVLIIFIGLCISNKNRNENVPNEREEKEKVKVKERK